MVLKHVAFAPASQKQLGSRLRSPLSIEDIASSKFFLIWFLFSFIIFIQNEN
jgi:hypothetical protein